MGLWHELRYVLGKLDRRRAERELDDEMRAHFEMEVERNLERGLSEAEARRAAHIAFGSAGLAKEDSRQEWGFAWVESAWRDLCYGARLLRKAPGFAFVAAGTLALGIGANTAVFSVVNGVLLRPLPVRDPERVLMLWENNVKDRIERDDVSPANFFDWQQRATSFEAMAFVNPHSLDYTGDGEPETWDAGLVSERLFEVLGTEAIVGRNITAEEIRQDARVVVLSHRVWKDRFGGDPGVVGRTLTLDGESFMVVGVMPVDFGMNLFDREKLVWAPQTVTEQMRQQRRATYLKVIAKVKPGVTADAARAEMETIGAQLAAELPQTNAGVGVTVVPVEEQVLGRVRPALVVLFLAVCVVLLIACVNVASLMLARAGAREREFAVRSAVGASRRRLVQQAVVESLLVAALGCAGGLALGWAGLGAMLALSPGTIPRLELVELDTTALAFAACVALATTVLFGLAPALQLSARDVEVSLRESGHTTVGSRSRTRLRGALVVAEVALAFVLLTGAGLLGRSFLLIASVDPGFAAERVASLQVFIWDRYRTPEERTAYVREAIERLSAVPGVEAVAVTTALPFLESSMDTSYPFHVEGSARPERGSEPTAFSTIASADYFRVIGVPVLSGRAFGPEDTADSTPVIVINETMARRHWPGEDPVGRRIVFEVTGRDGPRAQVREIVGVVGDVRHEGLDREPRAEFFRPYTQSPSGSVIVAARTAVPPATLLPALKAQLWEINPTQPFYNVAAADDLISDSLKARRFSLALLWLFAALALALAVVGIYGISSYVTLQRTREIGVRMAFGAKAADIARLVVGQGARLALAGVALGAVGALAATRLLSSQLYGVEPYDAATFVGTAVALLAVSVVACAIPARRAARTDPTEALREG